MRFLFILSLLILTAVPAAAQEPVAIVNGRPIYESDLLPLVQPQVQQLRNQEYELKVRALDNLVQESLLEQEANKRGLSKDQLLKEQVDSKLLEPSDAEIEAYYLGQRDRLNRPLNEVRQQLYDSLKQIKRQQLLQEFVKGLSEKANVAILLSPPRFDVKPAGDRLRGNAASPVVIVEFGDFQCPFCARAHPTLKDVLAKYKGQVSLSFRDFPLRQIHPQAQIAAEAAHCAGEQGKFWEFHDALYANSSQLQKNDLIQRAASLGLDEQKFKTCVDSGKYDDAIEKDVQEGTRLGINGTPAFYINGILLSGAQPAAAFEKVIDAELALQSQKSKRQ